MKPVKLTESVEFLCVNHFNRKLFDALIPLPQGTSYNSYLCLLYTSPSPRDRG